MGQFLNRIESELSLGILAKFGVIDSDAILCPGGSERNDMDSMPFLQEGFGDLPSSVRGGVDIIVLLDGEGAGAEDCDFRHGFFGFGVDFSFGS